MKTTIDPEARFLDLAAANNAEQFFADNYTEIRYTVVGYEFLQEIYRKPGHKLASDRYFQFVFGSFYVMSRLFVSADFVRRFYDKMDELKLSADIDTLDAAQIAAELDEKKVYFSFVTKMLNLADDTHYPIYDSKVALMFGMKGIETLPREQKIERYRMWYRQLIATYDALLQRSQTADILRRFRKMFGCAGMSDFRILDIIFWQLGKQEERTKK